MNEQQRPRANRFRSTSFQKGKQCYKPANAQLFFSDAIQQRKGYILRRFSNPTNCMNKPQFNLQGKEFRGAHMQRSKMVINSLLTRVLESNLNSRKGQRSSNGGNFTSIPYKSVYDTTSNLLYKRKGYQGIATQPQTHSPINRKQLFSTLELTDADESKKSNFSKSPIFSNAYIQERITAIQCQTNYNFTGEMNAVNRRTNALSSCTNKRNWCLYQK